MDICARAISHLQIRLQSCLAILAPVANWELGNYRLSLYVELRFVSAAVIFQIINLLCLSTVLVDQFLQILKIKNLLKKIKSMPVLCKPGDYCCVCNFVLFLNLIDMQNF